MFTTYRDSRTKQINEQSSGLRVICGWCQLVLKEGSPDREISHGICPTCAQIIRKEAGI